jgi:hypothetical protein
MRVPHEQRHTVTIPIFDIHAFQYFEKVRVRAVKVCRHLSDGAFFVRFALRVNRAQYYCQGIGGRYIQPGDGILFLGSSETVGGFSDMFTALDKKYKIYAKKTVDAPVNFEFVPRYDMEVEVGRRTDASNRGDLQKITEHILLNRFVPASVLVNDKLEIIQFIGQTGRYLDPTPGEATLNLLKLVKGGLQLELRLAFQRLKRTGTVRKEGVLIQLDGDINTAEFRNYSYKERAQ